MKKACMLILGLCLSCLSVQAQSGWTQIGNDIDGKVAQDNSGHSVSLSADGSVVAIGAPHDDIHNSAGCVRVYENISGNWMQIGADINGETADERLGWSVSLSADGSVLAMGVPYNNTNGYNSGSVRVYKNQGGVWTQIGDDIDGEAPKNYSGWSIDLSADGSVLAVGAPGNEGNGDKSGHVRVYKNQGGNWMQIGNDIDGKVTDYKLGYSVGLSADGTAVAVGFPMSAQNGPQLGYARVYKNQEGVWMQIGDDINGETPGDWFGKSVSLSKDGLILAVGAPGNHGNSAFAGHVRVYENISGNWIQIGDDIDGETPGSHSGNSVSLSLDGSAVAVGAPDNNSNGQDAGQVRVYVAPYVGIEEWQALAMEAYPNPTKNMVTLVLPGNTSTKQLCVYDMMGREMFVKTNLGDKVQIDFSDLSKGIYLVHLVTMDQKVFITRIAKE